MMVEIPERIEKRVMLKTMKTLIKSPLRKITMQV